MDTDRSRYEQSTVQHVAREVRAQLPPAVFRPVPSRLLWLPLHCGVIAACGAAVVFMQPRWPLALMCAVVAGHSWGCLGFLAHEALHHGVVRNRSVERWVGWLGFLPYCLSPALWTVWHNQAHHGHTGRRVADPDGFGDLKFWQRNRLVRALESLTPGSGTLRSAAFPFVWFSLHSFLVLVFHSSKNGYYERVSRRLVLADSAAMAGVWLLLALAIGPRAFLFVYVVPVLVANAVVMSYIATNHFLNPLTEVNDPLANTLSVTGPRWLETLHLQFGYHVEHHLFPTVSGRHARVVRDALIRTHGDRYLTMPHTRAMALLYTRPKVHGTHDTLVDPRTGVVFNVLAPGDLAMKQVVGAPLAAS